MTASDRYRGALLGLAAGDALGTTLEFRARGSFAPLTDMVGGGPFQMKPGEWTDDTSMALCLAESLVLKQGFDPIDQLTRYLSWWKDGKFSVKGYCFDIGITTAGALRRFEVHGRADSGSTDPGAAGNGSLMRLAPAPLAFAADPALAVKRAGDSSRTTHGAAECVDACRYYGGLLVGAIQGRSKDELLAPNFEPVPGLWAAEPLAPKVAAVAAGSFRTKAESAVSGSGYVVHTLEAALWAFAATDTFRDGALKVVNLGDDADTTGAVYGQLAGAYYGADAIPAEWREKLAMRAEIEALADGVQRLAGVA
ncbi:ADP-ribosylglycohydrolase family protein [Urbifossiella limnaea]|uniref:ADP-ribosyl-[dinitrogen reductase] glycohydrolase n=1 Tax=Urbifossiella limnaea TaxID=2528023 RepID=A0A517XNK6_9BACT|nr:ADP-ribosylglycohydrolase family protein [Urbifossiella limnaea]QDU19088.1 ADP-ribosyl-[dinitrogen reductase] glycohydrolase [Urbifossiella limnaea]